MKSAPWVAVILAFLVAAPLAGASEDEWEQRLTEKSKSVVYLKFVLKIQMNMGGQSRDREVRNEVLGVVLNDKGLVLTANGHFDPSAGIPSRMRSQIEMSAVPTDLKITFGTEEEEYEARLVARDSSLGLAFVQIMDLKGREVHPVRFDAAARIRVGQDLFRVTRLERAFDCAPVLGRMFVSGKVEKPRKMWALSGQLPPAGMPVFNMDGVAVGVISVQEGADGDSRPRPFLLPVSGFAKSIESSEKRADEALEEAAGAADEVKDGD